MKKFFTIFSLIFLFRTEAVLFDQYKDKVKHFDADTDLIRGMILASKGALQEQRAYGAINFYGIESGENNPDTCSVKDKGKDPMARLLILTHPSAGGSGLNAQGHGSISLMFPDVKKQAKIIAAMFEIARGVREKIAKKFPVNGPMLLNTQKRKIEQAYEQDIKSESGTIFEDIKTIKTIYDKIEKCDLKSIHSKYVAIENKIRKDIRGLREIVWKNKELLDSLSDLIFIKNGLIKASRSELVKDYTLEQLFEFSFENTEPKVDSEVQERINQIRCKMQKISVQSFKKIDENISEIRTSILNNILKCLEYTDTINTSASSAEEFLNDAKLINMVFNTVNRIEANIYNLTDDVNFAKLFYKAMAELPNNTENLAVLKQEIDEMDKIESAEIKKQLFQLRKIKELYKIILKDSPIYINRLLENFLEKYIVPKGNSVLTAKIDNVVALITNIYNQKDALEEIKNFRNRLIAGYAEYNKALKGFAEKYFQLKDENPQKNKLLFELGENVAEAVFLERLEGEIGTEDAEVKNKIRPYFPKYVNDLICAYVWGAFPGDKLNILIDELSQKGFCQNDSYKSPITEEIEKALRLDLSVVPFYVDQTPITNSKIPWEDGSKFSDCVETTLRQFFALILASAKQENGKLLTPKKYVGRLRAAVERIPGNNSDGKALRDFFVSNANIRHLANDGSIDVRCKWAEICSHKEKEGIVYGEDDHNLASSWTNIIKLFCYLMRGYPDMIREQNGNINLYDPKWLAGNLTGKDKILARQVRAARRIEEINTTNNNTEKLDEKAKRKSIYTGSRYSQYSGEESEYETTEKLENIQNIMNDLLGIRTDVELCCSKQNTMINFYVKSADFLKVKDEELINRYNQISIISRDGHSNMEKMKGGRKNIPANLHNMTGELGLMAKLYFSQAKKVGYEFPMFTYFDQVKVMTESPFNFDRIYHTQEELIQYALQNNGQYLEGLARLIICADSCFRIPSLYNVSKGLAPSYLKLYEVLIKNIKSAQWLDFIRSNLSEGFEDKLMQETVDTLREKAEDKLLILLNECDVTEEFINSLTFIENKKDDWRSLIQSHIERKLNSGKIITDDEYNSMTSYLANNFAELDANSFLTRESPLYQCIRTYLLAGPTRRSTSSNIKIPAQIRDETIELLILMAPSLDKCHQLLDAYNEERFPEDLVTEKFTALIPNMFSDKQFEEKLKRKVNLDYSELSDKAVYFIIKNLDKNQRKIFAQQVFEAYQNKATKMPLGVAYLINKYLDTDDQLKVFNDLSSNILDSLAIIRKIDPKLYPKFIKNNAKAICNIEKEDLDEIAHFIPYIITNKDLMDSLKGSTVLDYTEYNKDTYWGRIDRKVLAHWIILSYMENNKKISARDGSKVKDADTEDKLALLDKFEKNAAAIANAIPFIGEELASDFVDRHIDSFSNEEILSNTDNFIFYAPFLLKHNQNYDFLNVLKKIDSCNPREISTIIERVMPKLANEISKKYFAKQILAIYKEGTSIRTPGGYFYGEKTPLAEIIEYVDREDQMIILDNIDFEWATYVFEKLEDDVVFSFIRRNISKFKTLTNFSAEAIPYFLADPEIREHLTGTPILDLYNYDSRWQIGIMPNLKDVRVKREFIKLVRQAYQKRHKKLPVEFATALDKIEESIKFSISEPVAGESADKGNSSGGLGLSSTFEVSDKKDANPNPIESTSELSENNKAENKGNTTKERNLDEEILISMPTLTRKSNLKSNLRIRSDSDYYEEEDEAL